MGIKVAFNLEFPEIVDFNKVRKDIEEEIRTLISKIEENNVNYKVERLNIIKY
jgi:hypothetical protein